MVDPIALLNAKILIVDDLTADLELLRQVLEAAGHKRVSSTTNPFEVCDLHRKQGFDLILLDLAMPGMDGFEVMAALLELALEDPCPVLAVAAEPKQELRALEAGAKDFISKPYVTAEVVARVHTLLEVRLLASELRAHNDALKQQVREGTSALEASETRYRRLFEAARDGILILEAATGRIVEVNPFMTELTGYSADEMQGRYLWDIAPLEEIAESRASFRQLLAEEYVRYEDLPLKTRDGRRIGVAFLSSIYQVDGEKVIQCNIRDMSEHLRAQAALRAKDLLLSEAQRLGHVGSWYFDGTGPISWSDEMYRLYGVSPETFVPTPEALIELLHPDDRGAMEAWISACAAGEAPAALEYRIMLSDGTTHFFSGRGEAVLDEAHRLLHMAGTVQDVTQQTLAKQAQARLATAVEQVGETIIITDAGSLILYVNPAFEKATGYTREEALGQNIRMLKSGKHDAAFYRQMWDTLGRGDAWFGHLISRRKDGTHLEEETSISPVRDPAGHVVNYVAVKRDNSRMARLQAQLLQSQKMEAIGSLAGGIAHDFNNLLSVILGFSTMAMEALPPDTPIFNDMQEVKRAGEHAAVLTRQLLAFSRKQVRQPELLDVNAIITGFERLLGRILGKEIELSLSLGPALKPVLADAGQIEQLLLNLVVNARDAMPGGGSVTIATSAVETGASGAADRPGTAPGHRVVLSVTDTGVGMDEATQATIFEPFFTTKPAGKGTGLGLSTVFGIVKQSGGDIRVHSEPGAGARFQISLPCPAAQAVKVGVPRAVVPRRMTGGETILIVEDDAPLRAVTRRALEGAGYKVLTAANGEEAISICAGHGDEIHLLATDVVLPRMKGPEIARALTLVKPRLKVLYVSGYTDDTISYHGVLTAGTNFLAKPFTGASFVRKVRDVLCGEDIEVTGSVEQHHLG